MPKYCNLLALIILIEFNPILAKAQDFKASVVKVDITPDSPQYLAGYGARQSTGILDRIYHRIVVMDDGLNQFFLVSSDFGKIDPTLYNQVASILNEKFGIIREDFWWSVTHTHSAPEIGAPGLSAIFMPERYKQPIASDYTEFVVQKLVEGIAEAKAKLEPASLGVGWGFSQANINRRAIDVDGKASLGLNPDGPVDRRIGIIRIDKKDGSPLVLISNYAIHGTVMGPQNLDISGDAPGIVSEYVEEKIGAPLLFINGAAGNLAPIYSVYPNAKAGHLGEFRVLLGDKILDANEKISFTTNKVVLQVGLVTVETPRKEGLDWPSNLKDYSRSTETGKKMVLIPINFLKINENVVIWSAPLELFCEISNEIRDRSPFPYTFYFGYTNGNLRYLVTKSAYKHGGYEPNASPFTPSAAGDLTESVVGYLQGEMRSGF
ncbi:MAG: neutral/alkaline non-lysosomal ceramidase N-terminal domain-containing protein [Anditalea sp.]